jgi:hypothetical protein
MRLRLLFVLLLCACSRSKDGSERNFHDAGVHSSRPRPLPSFGIRPPDLSTNVGQITPTIQIDNFGEPIGEDALKAIAQTVRLVTWPDLVDVEANKTLDDVKGLSPGAYSRIEFFPTSTLSERWYAVLVRPDGTNLAATTYPGIRRLADGSFFHRFRPDSQPVVAGLILNTSAQPYLEIAFSEAMVAPADAATAFGDQAVPLSCQTQLQNRFDGGVGSLRLNCGPEAVPLIRYVTISGALEGASGRKLMTGNEDLRVVLPPQAAFEPCGSDCKIYRPTVPGVTEPK